MLVAPLQANYTALLGVVGRVVEQVAEMAIGPVQKVFQQMTSLPGWGHIDTTAIHSLPSE